MDARRTGRLELISRILLAGAVVGCSTGIGLFVVRSVGHVARTTSGESANGGAARSLSPSELIAAGREQFTRIRHADGAPDPKVTWHRMFNARSCAECHRQGGVGGAGPNENNVQILSGLRISPDFVSRVQFAAGAMVFHRESFAPDYADWKKATLARLAFIRGLGDGPLEQRNTPPLFGLGLIESIPQAAVDEGALNQPHTMRGRSPRLADGTPGRFGWKSNTATLAAFNENACAVELGLTTPSFTPATFPPADVTAATMPPLDGTLARSSPMLRSATRPAPRDMSAGDIAALTRFVASLPAPRQEIDPAREELIAEGERRFHLIGCTTCHTPNLGGVGGLYSDLLVHRVGTTGGGSFYGGTPRESESDPNAPGFIRDDEFRTPPLWGVADSGPYLHDGSAATLEAAILRHEMQAAEAKNRFRNQLSGGERWAVITFLNSLRAPQ